MRPGSGLDPWVVLGLVAGETDRSRIRKAYAASLRANPPEGDALAFRRVRDAYELLSRSTPDELSWLIDDLKAEGESSSDDPVRAGTQPDLQPPGARSPSPPVSFADPPEARRLAPSEGKGKPAEGVLPIPAPPLAEIRPSNRAEPAPLGEADWAAAVRVQLDRARTAGASESGRALRHVLTRAWGESATSWRRREALLQMLRSGYSVSAQGSIASATSRRVILDGLAGGAHEFILWVANALARTGRERPLASLGSLILEHEHEMARGDAALHLSELAAAMAIPLPKLAEKLADAAYDRARSDGQRRFDTSRLDSLVRVGREAAFWRPAARAQLAWIVEQGGIPEGESIGTFDLIAESLAATSRAPWARQMLEQLAPRVLNRARAGRRPRGATGRGREGAASRRKRKGQTIKIFFVVWIVVIVLRGCYKMLSAPHEREQRTQDALKDMHRELDELRGIPGSTNRPPRDAEHDR